VLNDNQGSASIAHQGGALFLTAANTAAWCARRAKLN
jgi:hypothetical protein